MELVIGEIIYKLRKEKGITQETLANAVGVSVAAVSKWESKNSYPDITILPSIARYFNVSIDKLLNYKIEISKEEVMEIAKKCASLFEKDTVENAITTCEDYIKQYPNNLFLKFRMGSLYMISMASAKDEDEAKVMLKRAIELLEESSNSSDKEIYEASKYTLSSLYSMNDEYDKAEEVLLSLPKVMTDRDDMLVLLYINQGKDEEAIKLLRNLTYKKFTGLKVSLDSYINLYTKEKNSDKAKEVLKLQDKLIEDFGLENIYGVSSNLVYAEMYAKEENAEKTLNHIEKIIKYFEIDYNFDGHILFDKIELFNGVHSKSYLIVSLKKIILDERYDFLREDERFNKIVQKLESIN